MGMSQNFPVNSFKWGGETFQFNEDFKYVFMRLMFNILESIRAS